MPGVDQGGDCRTRMDVRERAGVREAHLSFRRAEEGGAWHRTSGKEEAEGETLEEGAQLGTTPNRFGESQGSAQRRWSEELGPGGKRAKSG